MIGLRAKCLAVVAKPSIRALRADHPEFCSHYEIETYTWAVLPGGLRTPVVDQMVREYRWVLERMQPPLPCPPLS